MSLNNPRSVCEDFTFVFFREVKQQLVGINILYVHVARETLGVSYTGDDGWLRWSFVLNDLSNQCEIERLSSFLFVRA